MLARSDLRFVHIHCLHRSLTPFAQAEIGVAAVGSVVMSAIVYYGVRLQGSFLIFWLTYFATLCVGICECGCSAWPWPEPHAQLGLLVFDPCLTARRGPKDLLPEVLHLEVAQARTQTRTHTCTHMHTCAYAHTHTHTHEHAHAHVHACTHVEAARHVVFR